MDISIEHDKGDIREWKDRDGTEGKTKMTYPYGYIRRTVGADEEQIDCYVGPNKDSEKVFIIHQMAVPSFKRYDEDKVMLAFTTKREAKAAYLMHYSDPRFLGSMTVTTVENFKRTYVKKSTNVVKSQKIWRKGGSDKCTTGICDLLDGVAVPSHEPFPYALSLLDYDVHAPPAHGNCGCSLEGENLYRSLAQEDPSQDQTLAMPQMTQMPSTPQQPVGPQIFVDPHDVETYEGVESLLGRLGSVKDPELMQIAAKIWGKGYNYEGEPPAKARGEILGWLLDQRDLLGVEPHEIAPAQPFNEAEEGEFSPNLDEQESSDPHSESHENH